MRRRPFPRPRPATAAPPFPRLPRAARAFHRCPLTRDAAPFAPGLLSRLSAPGGALSGDADSDSAFTETAPFELEVVEAALLEVTGQLDTLLLDASSRVASLLRLLPQRLAITAEVLEELRLVKQSLVELDSRAGAIRSLLLEVRRAALCALAFAARVRAFVVAKQPSHLVASCACRCWTMRKTCAA